MEAIFSSVAGRYALRSRVLELIADASFMAEKSEKDVDINVMTFSFTDPWIADSLIAAAQLPRLTVRLIADWTQRAIGVDQQVARLAQLGLPNLNVRYKKDQPYVWDAQGGCMRWSYHASRGLLHHKTLSVVVDGEPWRLACGSSNWTAKAADSYENLLILTDSAAGCRELMMRMEIEFEALWSDGRVSLSPKDAQAHFEAIADIYRGDATVAPGSITGLIRGEAEPLRVLNSQYYVGNDSAPQGPTIDPISPEVVIAFSARLADEERSRGGYAAFNSGRCMTLCSPTGKTRRVPLTITTLALDVIFRARPGETLLIAMYGLSTRVPEYGALLNAARRGVRLRVLLDGKVGKRTADSLSRVRQLEQLAIQVKIGHRMMHQKYIVNPNSATVLTGTANMSTDSSARHSEHRIRILGDKTLAREFATDFEMIWSRVNSEA